MAKKLVALAAIVLVLGLLMPDAIGQNRRRHGRRMLSGTGTPPSAIGAGGAGTYARGRRKRALIGAGAGAAGGTAYRRGRHRRRG
jgi:hypothetical protein